MGNNPITKLLEQLHPLTKLQLAGDLNALARHYLDHYHRTYDSRSSLYSLVALEQLMMAAKLLQRLADLVIMDALEDGEEVA